MAEIAPVHLTRDATPNLGGYPIGGVMLDRPANSHLQYAVTWYGLAVALVAIMGVAWWRRAFLRHPSGRQAGQREKKKKWVQSY